MESARRIVTCFSLALLGLTGTANCQDTVLDLGSRRELFVDSYLIDRLEGASLRLQRPIDAGPVLRFDQPWEGAFSGYTTVIRDGAVYRLYYRGLPVPGPDGSTNASLCYAESADGIRWEKPTFDFYPTDTSEPTNRLIANRLRVAHNVSPFLDKNPNAEPSARFKAVGGTKDSGLIGWKSPDGVHWSQLQDEPVFSAEGWVFDSQNVCFWSEAEQQYLLYYRVVPNGVRAVARATSPDFVHWSEPVVMEYSDTNSTEPSQQLYTNQTHPYYRAPHILLSTAARFMPGRRVINDEQAEAIGVSAKYAGDSSDAVLMSTRGGSRYDRTFLSALIRPGIGAENWVSRTNYPALNIVPTSETEMSLYVNQNYGQPTSHLRRYVFRIDGLAALHGPYEGGVMVTKPLVFSGQELSLNFATSAAGSIRVSVLDEAGQPIAGFASEDCDEIIGNTLDQLVSWKGSSDIGDFSGKTIRLQFELHDADLYSLQFR